MTLIPNDMDLDTTKDPLNMMIQEPCLGCVSNNDDILGDSEKRLRFKEIVAETFKVSGATNIGDFVPVLRWIGMDKIENKLKELQVKRDNFMQDLIDEHRKIKSEKKKQMNSTLIDVLLELQENDPQNYKDKIIRGMRQVMLSAGTDNHEMVDMAGAPGLSMLKAQPLVARCRPRAAELLQYI
ncbi:cytochrome P450 81Q32-like [Salvia divinorum]|uniref:Cytochrome P450 81Q32-like n=1 Tax=Salvia divinorum TaxID=28513 RepID=A0ABD1G8B5_SALDI